MAIERLGKYEIRGTLGKGAMGTVYAAWDPIISRQVAIKTVRLPEASDIDAVEELARFKREAQAAGRLTHPNIVGIFDYGETDEVAYIVMEFVDGRTLKSVLDADERMPLPAVGRVMADLLAGLGYSHERGVVHRDIKPANVMIVGGGGQAKIADFGIARIESSNLTQAGTIMGTPAYMSPEQFMGQTVDSRTDIYSSGVLLFQLLTGERPFEGSMATIMHKALNTLPPKPSDLSVTAPVALDAVVARAMARRPDDRYPSASVFAAAVADAIEGRASALPPGLGDEFDGESTVVRPAARPTPPQPSVPVAETPKTRPRSNVPLLAGITVLVLAALGAGGAWWSGLIGAPEPPNAQIAGGTTVVTPPSPPSDTGQETVVAVKPRSAPDSGPPVSTVQIDTTTPPPPVAPRDGVTQVVPPLTSATTAAPEVIPPLVAPDNSATASTEPTTPDPPKPDLGSTSHAEVAPATRVEPAVTPVPPPPIHAPDPPTVTTPSQSAAIVSPEALRRAVASAVDSSDCAVIRGDLTRSGTLSMQGVVGGGAPLQDLLRRLRDAAPTSPLDWTVEEVTGPYCSVLNLIRPYARPFGSVTGGMDVGLRDGQTALRDDDKIDIHAQVPAFPAFLQIDYFSSDGTVLHVINAAQGSPALAARSTQTYAAGTVGTPFGTDLIVAIASSVPLFTKGQALPGDAEPYLRQLRTGLDAAIKRRAELAAGALVVHTSPKS